MRFRIGSEIINFAGCRSTAIESCDWQLFWKTNGSKCCFYSVAKWYSHACSAMGRDKHCIWEALVFPVSFWSHPYFPLDIYTFQGVSHPKWPKCSTIHNESPLPTYNGKHPANCRASNTRIYIYWTQKPSLSDCAIIIIVLWVTRSMSLLQILKSRDSFCPFFHKCYSHRI